MIIWLASYPKSGNTFVRSLLSSYFYTQDGNFNFDLLKKIQQFPINEDFYKIGVDVNNKYLVAENYIKAQEEIIKNKNITFLKTHSSFCKMYNRFNFSSLKTSLGVIYIVRDPRNVAISFANHNSKPITDTVQLLTNDLAIGNEKKEVEVYLGSWNLHYNSWKVYQGSQKYLLVKYEDLISDTKNTFLKMLLFIKKLSNFEINNAKVDKAIKNTFNRLKEMENKNGFEEAKINDNTGKKVKFFNIGPGSNWKKALEKHDQDKIQNAFKKEMLELGYI